MEKEKIAFNVIKNVIDAKYDLKASLKNETKDLSRSDSLIVSEISGVFFRNYFLINQMAESLDFIKDSDEMIELGLLYINNALLKRIDPNKMFNEFLSFIIQKKHSLKKDQIFFIKEVISKKRTYEFFNIKKGSLTYYSIRFNKPEWLIKLATRQFGKKQALSLLYELSAMPQQFVSISYSKSFAPNKFFNKQCDDLYEYTNPISIRKEEAFYNGNIYLTQIGYKSLINKFDYKNEELTCILNEENTIAYDFLKRFVDKENKINLITSLKKEESKILNNINSYEIKDLKIVEKSEKDYSLNNKEKSNFTLYIPKSSNFELFRRNPEYGVYFKGSNLDTLVSSLKFNLNEVSSTIKKEGMLLYLTPTFYFKETKYLIENFLNEHKDFELVEEKMYLPNEKENSLFYYALLKRKS